MAALAAARWLLAAPAAAAAPGARAALARLAIAATAPCCWAPRAAAAAAAAALAAPPARGFRSGVTKSSVKKRIRFKKSGAILRRHANKRHLNLHKSSARLNRLSA
jgi:hypothetical protein